MTEITTDVDQRLQRERLEQLGLSVTAISHDFNNLLAEITGYCALALEDPAIAKSSIKNAKDASERARDLCCQLMDYAAGRMTLVPIAVDRILGDSLMVFSRQFPEVTVGLDCTVIAPKVLGNVVECRRIFANLLQNAAHAMNGTGDLVVTVAVEDCPMRRIAPGLEKKNFLADAYVVISISDTGCGIDDATRQRIFEPAFTTKADGHGFGLHSVLAAMREHHGAIDCRSKPGVGTTFTLYFPVGEPSAN